MRQYRVEIQEVFTSDGKNHGGVVKFDMGRGEQAVTPVLDRADASSAQWLCLVQDFVNTVTHSGARVTRPR